MPVRPLRRFLVGAIAALTAASGVVFGAASPAQAQQVDVFCTGTLSTTLDPGLRLFTQTITTQNNFIYSPCESTDLELTYGAYDSTIVGDFSCLDPMQSYTDSKIIEWNNGETSTFEFNGTVTTIGGQFVTTHIGVITDGQFAGGAANELIIGPTFNLVDCLFAPGITNRTSVVGLTITGTS